MASVTERGKIYEICPLRSGTSKAGNPWANQQVVFEVVGFQNSIRRVAASTNSVEILSLLETLKPGIDVEFSYSVSARDWTDPKTGEVKWFSDINLFSLKVENPAAIQQRAMRPAPAPRPASPAPVTDNQSEHTDDLPF